MLKKLKELNHVPIYSVHDEKFKSYGMIVKDYDFSELINYMNEKSEMPEEDNVYYPSVKEMENLNIYKTIKSNLYGEMDIQIGYCNGKNSTLNGFEYHKGSEINIAVTDLILILGHTWDIKNNTYNVKDVEVFYIDKGYAIEMFETTLHLSPCKVSEDGFKDIIVLPKNTNTPLIEPIEVVEERDKLLLMKNKWVIAHPERKRLTEKGAFPGVIGENLKILYK